MVCDPPSCDPHPKRWQQDLKAFNTSFAAGFRHGIELREKSGTDSRVPLSREPRNSGNGGDLLADSQVGGDTINCLVLAKRM